MKVAPREDNIIYFVRPTPKAMGQRATGAALSTKILKQIENYRKEIEAKSVDEFLEKNCLYVLNNKYFETNLALRWSAWAKLGVLMGIGENEAAVLMDFFKSSSMASFSATTTLIAAKVYMSHV